MNTERIKQIQAETGLPDSVSVQQALIKVWNECEQEKTSFEATMLREKTNKLEKDIKTLVEKFLRDVGECNVDIKTNFSFTHLSGKRRLTDTGIKVFVTV